jgi:hypothetical protein
MAAGQQGMTYDDLVEAMLQAALSQGRRFAGKTMMMEKGVR